VKADLNAPRKKKTAVPLVFNFDSLNGNNGPQKTNLMASELRTRLEQILAEESSNIAQSRPSSSIQMQTSLTSRPQSAPSPKAKSAKKSGKSSGKFKGKVSGKIMTVVERSNEAKQKQPKVRNDNLPAVRRKSKSSTKSKSQETSTEKDDEEPEKHDDEKLEDEVQEPPVDPDNLMLQPDNLRSSKIKLLSTAHENSKYFKDPSRSLALVKEWRKRLETTRASCEQMLEQLKAFRDPPAARSSLSSLTNSYNLPQTGKSLLS
jgi:hypothetical protein